MKIKSMRFRKSKELSVNFDVGAIPMFTVDTVFSRVSRRWSLEKFKLVDAIYEKNLKTRN